MASVNHPIVIIIIIAQLLRDGQRFAHLTMVSSHLDVMDGGRPLGVDLLQIRQIAALHVSDCRTIQ